MTTTSTQPVLHLQADDVVAPATIFVDPTCPFAWITRRWLAEVAAQTGLQVRVELMSLSVVNEHRELEPWYRDYNDRAWGPARVAAGILARPDDASAWTSFYETFGARRHVAGVRDDTTNIALTLSELGLPGELAMAAEDSAWDDDLRRRTAIATGSLDDGGGTPIVHLGGRELFGPVLTEIPRGAAAVRLWHAVALLATTAGFSEIKGARAATLSTG